MQLARTALILVSPPKSCILLSSHFRIDWRSDAVDKSSVSVANSENFDRRRSLICNASSASSSGGVAEVQRPIAEEPGSVAIQVRAGKPMPFGATVCDGGVNFAIFSSGATSATLCLLSLEDLRAAVISRGEYGVLGPDGNCWPQMAGMIPLSSNEFDWEGDLPLRYPQKDLIIYEMHVRGYTKHDSSKTDFPGTYLGAVDKLDHLKVLLDVVFNHTAEGNENGPILSFRGIGNNIYYMLAPKGEFYNYSGCGNTFNCNHPIVCQFIVDCLRYWVTEMHVDGFRFDLASIMTRASSQWDAANVYGRRIEGDPLTTGTPLNNPPLIDMISNDPILRGIKLVAEAWDAGGLYQVGQFPHWYTWSEWNGQYRDTVRQFIKGTDGFSGAFAQCLCGSPNLYQEGGRKPWNSINFACAHDGFTLADLVTYNNKNNLSNGENNRDGENHNLSWNCGEEGEFASISVRRLRKRVFR